MYLHEDREAFRDLIEQVSDKTGRTPMVVEKDYYVTLILFRLVKFTMRVQALERTYIDKVFALCDYYLQGKSKRYSRHLYDIYKLTPMIEFDKVFLELVKETRAHRARMSICPSAQDGIDVPAVIIGFCDKDFYREDYHAITSYFTAEVVSYEDVIDNMRKIAESNLF